MFKIPKKVADRFSDNLKRFQTIALAHKSRDVSEADTVTLVKDILAEMFGYSTTIRSATQGKAEFSMEFSRYAPVPGNISEELIAKAKAKAEKEKK